MADSPLVKKLQLKPGQRAIIIKAPPGYLGELAPLPEGVELVNKPEGTFDFVQLFVNVLLELGQMAPAAIGAVKRDGLLWVSYPKQSPKLKTDINRDTCRGALQKLGVEAVSQVAINEVWSALRFRSADLVRRKTQG